MVKVSASRAADLGFDSQGNFSGWSHTGDFNIGTPVVTLPSARRFKVRAGTGWPVSIYCDWVRWKVLSASFISVW